MTKYQEYYKKMVAENKSLFDNFKEIHDLYKTNEREHESKFNQIGGEVMEIIRDWEKRLCGYSEKGQNAVYSKNLSEKFWGLIRKDFSHIDLVGCVSE